jgi:hydroxysqualene synthase
LVLRQLSRTGENHPVPVDHYENFPVASVLCPPALRPAVVAIYQFARTADDIADEDQATPAQRLTDLAEFRADLRATWAQQTPGPRWPQVFSPLARRAQEFRLPVKPLHDLLDAFEQDVRNPPYPHREALLDYCSRSAHPVGRLLLHLYGIDDPVALRQSDDMCSALQLINFWQDLSIDGPRGRCYVPHSDMEAHGVSSRELAALADSPAARQLVQALCEWAHTLMLRGAPLALRVPGRAGWELRLVVQGGLRILEKIRLMHHASLSHRPTLSALDAPRLLWRAVHKNGIRSLSKENA